MSTIAGRLARLSTPRSGMDVLGLWLHDSDLLTDSAVYDLIGDDLASEKPRDNNRALMICVLAHAVECPHFGQDREPKFRTM